MKFLFALAFVVAAGAYEITDQCFLDITIDGNAAGTIVVGLFGMETPKTVRNFMEFCKGTAVDGLSYSGTPFHRIIPHFVEWGGDVLHGDGSGTITYDGKKSFADENFNVPFDKKYQVAMANAGPNTNGCQFMITTTAATWLTGKNVVFGQVTDGHTVVNKIESNPNAKVMIARSGEYFGAESAVGGSQKLEVSVADLIKVYELGKEADVGLGFGLLDAGVNAVSAVAQGSVDLVSGVLQGAAVTVDWMADTITQDCNESSDTEGTCGYYLKYGQGQWNCENLKQYHDAGALDCHSCCRY